MSSKKSVLLLTIVMPALFLCMYLGTLQDQVFDDRYVGDRYSKAVQGPCNPEYAKAIVTPNTTSALWTSYMEIMRPDGSMPICLYGLGQKPNAWRYSLDGRYLYTSTTLTHSWHYAVYQLSTGKVICDGLEEGGQWWFKAHCPLIRMADGRWWSGVLPDIVLKTKDPKLWDLVNSSFIPPAESPNGEWVAGQTTEWFFASSDGRTIRSFSMPYPYTQSPPCLGYPGQIAWSADSKEFAVRATAAKTVFVWSVQKDGSIQQEDAVLLNKCPLVLELSIDGKILAK